MPRFAVILPAAGQSSRFQDPFYKKPFASLAGKAVWLHAAEKFLARNDVCQVLIVVAPEERQNFLDRFEANIAFMEITVVDGGKERSDSVFNALAKVKAEADFIAVHDAARPLIADEWITKVFDAAEQTGAAILGVPVVSTLKRVKGNQIETTAPREGLWEAQTPQVFRRDWLEEAYAKHRQTPVTDDAQLLELAGRAVTMVPSSPINFKVTTKEDLRFAEHALAALPKPKLNPLHPFGDDDHWR